ncbi:MAG: DUF4178 domain-containing protein [Bacteroidota bacterium]|nr:DUF4178 domain-containing protein [Bacteroidota bacterium]
MGLFDRFKKKEKPDYDPTNLSVRDFDKGFVFEYDMQNWIVKEAYKYDWGSNSFSKEYKIDNGQEQLFLSVDDGDELEITISKKVKVRLIDEDLPEYIVDHERPPKKLHYKGKTFYQENESPGYFHDMSNSDKDAWDEFIAWDYYDEDEKLVICIEQWEEREFEASYGKVVEEYEISNILPGASE